MIKNKYLKAISIIEYCILFVVIAATLLGIQAYLKRAISGRWQEVADGFGHGRLYDAQTQTALFWDN